jgi:hypothetical protein
MLAYDYPLLGVFWSITLFSIWLIIVFTVIWAFIDNFRRTDHSGVMKAVWALIIILIPVLGMFVYLIARPATANAYA